MAAQLCPVVGTTNTVLPPSHPEVDLDKRGQTCPVVGATTDHHHTLSTHPRVPIPKDADAEDYPALKGVADSAEIVRASPVLCHSSQLGSIIAMIHG